MSRCQMGIASKCFLADGRAPPDPEPRARVRDSITAHCLWEFRFRIVQTASVASNSVHMMFADGLLLRSTTLAKKSHKPHSPSRSS
eukprot:5659560-Pyramimonas_sp.AAC.1